MIDYTHDFIKVPLGVLWLLVGNRNALIVYLLCMSRVRYSKNAGLRGLDIGQLVIGEHELAAHGRLTRAMVRTALHYLVKVEIIARTATNRGSLITMLGYKQSTVSRDSSQPSEHAARDQPLASEFSATEHASATNEIRDPRSENESEDPTVRGSGAPYGTVPRHTTGSRRSAPKPNIARRTRAAMALFEKLYKQRHELDYRWTSKQRGSVARIVADHGAEVPRRIEILFRDPPFFLEGVFTWDTFIRNFAQLAMGKKEAEAQTRAEKRKALGEDDDVSYSA